MLARAGLVALVAALASGALAQDLGRSIPAAAAARASRGPQASGEGSFWTRTEPDRAQARSIGFYARGCLAGAKALPVDGETWRVMRLSRNRFWGHPAMIAFLERFSQGGGETDMAGILVGDISQPRGGPMMTGHASHQIGLDADVWLTPMPDEPLTREDREQMSAVDMVRPDGLSVDPAHWSERQAGVIQAAAEEPEVERIFVNAAIKKALCEKHAGEAWMNKVRAYWGHNYHFHIRIRCPEGENECQPQEPVPPGDGCDKSLNWWFTDEALHPKIEGKPKPPIPMSALPPECRQVAVEK